MLGIECRQPGPKLESFQERIIEKLGHQATVRLGIGKVTRLKGSQEFENFSC